MEAFNRLLVGLDFSHIDPKVLDYTGRIAELYPQSQAYFYHVAPSLEIPVAAYPINNKDVSRLPLDERLQQDLINSVSQHVDLPVDYKYDCNVVEGKVTQQLMHACNVKQIDLAIVGRKHADYGSGLAPLRFLRNTECSVWFVPEEASTDINRIVVATDFSDDSNHALRMALDMARRMTTRPEVEILHVFTVPTDIQFRLDRTYTQYADIVRKDMTSFMEDYLKRFDTEGVGTVKMSLLQDSYFNAGRHIFEYVEESSPDLVIMGARGHSMLGSLLLGSTTERVLSYDKKHEIPMLVVRPGVA